MLRVRIYFILSIIKTFDFEKKEILEIQYSRVLVRNQNIFRARDWAELCTQLSLYIETDSVSVMTSQNLSS